MACSSKSTRHVWLVAQTFARKLFTRPGPNFIELLSRNEQDTLQKLYMWHGILAGNPVKHYFVVLSYFLCLSSSMKLGPECSITIKPFLRVRLSYTQQNWKISDLITTFEHNFFYNRMRWGIIIPSHKTTRLVQSRVYWPNAKCTSLTLGLRSSVNFNHWNGKKWIPECVSQDRHQTCIITHCMNLGQTC